MLWGWMWGGEEVKERNEGEKKRILCSKRVFLVFVIVVRSYCSFSFFTSCVDRIFGVFRLSLSLRTNAACVCA